MKEREDWNYEKPQLMSYWGDKQQEMSKMQSLNKVTIGMKQVIRVCEKKGKEEQKGNTMLTIYRKHEKPRWSTEYNIL